MDATAFPKLTRHEREILNDRLAQGDCIAEVLSEDNAEPGEAFYAPEETEAVADLLLKGDVSGAVALNRDLCAAVLVNSVEGSIYAAVLRGKPSLRRKYAAACKAGCSLASKVGEYVGREIRFPIE